MLAFFIPSFSSFLSLPFAPFLLTSISANTILSSVLRTMPLFRTSFISSWLAYEKLNNIQIQSLLRFGLLFCDPLKLFLFNSPLLLISSFPVWFSIAFQIKAALSLISVSPFSLFGLVVYAVTNSIGSSLAFSEFNGFLVNKLGDCYFSIGVCARKELHKQIFIGFGIRKNLIVTSFSGSSLDLISYDGCCCEFVAINHSDSD